MPRLLFIADGRSQIALNWIRFFLDRKDDVHLVSSFDCEPDPRLASYTFLPVALSEWKRPSSSRSQQSTLSSNSGNGFKNFLRQWLGPLTLPRAASRLLPIIQYIQPDLIHAMRIPFEGMLAAQALRQSSRPSSRPPLLVSIWGNDFTLHAPSTPLMKSFTQRTMLQTDALHADCKRDVRLAQEWGFSLEKPAIVLPGAGGVQTDIFYPPLTPVSLPVAINPRGFRTYVNTAAFFQAVPLVLDKVPQARFICPAIADISRTDRWLKDFGVASSVELLPVQTRSQMAELFRQARVAVSPSNHDGTPNTLLEAMACGCLPVAGDLESLREWIDPNSNGLLTDPNDPAAIARAIVQAFRDDELCQRARTINLGLIDSRAEYTNVMHQALDFYLKITNS